MNSGNRKKQVRIQPKDDLGLPRGVLANNPFKNRSAWTDIASTLSRSDFQLDTRRVRERVGLLIDNYHKQNAESLKRSGIDEKYGEEETLLQEIIIMMMILMMPLHTKKISSINNVGYLREKNEAEIDFRKQELDVRKQQLKLDEEKKIELEKQERLQKLENEKQDKQLMFDLLKKCLK
ncbi:NID [Mytilus coruscus]|uniref:NID n=1 Tax=Mytilus coruscus TaxID=42192 RepID=A0A6J8A6J3_MYTCO|nr:NID [Mytilus coruscus]